MSLTLSFDNEVSRTQFMYQEEFQLSNKNELFIT